jgi:hypothetical protein
VSWAPTPSGYCLYFNRDERLTRAEGRPPAAFFADGVEIVAPTDAEAGGTWIGVNQFGLTACLLNRYHESPADPRGGWTSRGLLLRSLLSSQSAAALLARVGSRDLAEFQPFTICAVDPTSPVGVIDWTGKALLLAETGRPGMIRTSSGRDQDRAETLRAATFRTLVPADAPAITPADLDRFHRSHLPERGPFSVCMHRPEAETRSMTSILVGDGMALLSYEPGPPGERPTPVTATLLLTRAP